MSLHRYASLDPQPNQLCWMMLQAAWSSPQCPQTLSHLSHMLRVNLSHLWKEESASGGFINSGSVWEMLIWLHDVRQGAHAHALEHSFLLLTLWWDSQQTLALACIYVPSWRRCWVQPPLHATSSDTDLAKFKTNGKKTVKRNPKTVGAIHL